MFYLHVKSPPRAACFTIIIGLGHAVVILGLNHESITVEESPLWDKVTDWVQCLRGNGRKIQSYHRGSVCLSSSELSPRQPAAGSPTE